MITGVLITIILPLVLSVESYGYWQMFFFYSSFLGLFMYGFLDGIHLKFAGKKYEELNKEEFKSYFLFTILLSFLNSIFFILLSLYFIDNNDRLIVFILLGLNIIIFNVNGFFVHIYQITSRFSSYSIVIVLDRLIFIIVVIPFIFIDINYFLIFIVISTVARLVVVGVNLYISKDLIFRKHISILKNKKMILNLMKSGIFLTGAGLVSMIIVGYPRLLVDYFFGIKEFSIFSFGNSLLSIALQVVIAISAVMYPTIKQMGINEYENVNRKINEVVWILGATMLLTYFPIVILITKFLGNFSSVLEYLYILFPLMIFQSKSNIVLTTFYKTLRLEKNLFLINLTGLLINILISTIVFTYIQTLYSLILSSTLLYIIFTYILEIYMYKKNKWKKFFSYWDFIVILVFIATTQISNIFVGFICYILFIIIFLIAKRKYVFTLITKFKKQKM